MAKLAIVAALNVLLYGFHNQPDTLPELWLSLSHHLKKGSLTAEANSLREAFVTRLRS
ncbi:uncharacterized protein PHALS_08808 [Plasmopara halstedii]|uniref:RxLR-like protein n=1 Tax=Plasmopara halstedii TaxID=4781 RepID=A0A0P1ACX5_PLAHL|nr:uncharacterized protein PHALS_08808 [Plasmopara halstedii]CEG38754.1 hypothetical protein PHALS_08808 [Plasmopara halstedii]|eukprot:XP_024575123.1 hypothetical protein PHALS_08808 [Plasmopara halstedii]